MSIASVQKPVYYLAVTSLHLFMLKWHDHLYPNPYYQKVCWLTMMSFFINLIYYSYMLMASLGIIKRKLNKLEDSYFKMAFCISFVVFLLFWTIMAVDRNMLLNPEDNTPTILNIFTHGGNFVLNIFEHIVVKPRPNASNINTMFFLGFLLTYSACLKIIFYLTGFAAYPFVEKAPLLHYMIINIVGLLMVALGDKTFRMLIKDEFREVENKIIKAIKC